MQRRNPEMVDILRPDFQHRAEPNFAWRAAPAMLQDVPVLRAAWPMSIVDYQNPQAADISGNGYHLTNNGSSDFGYDDLAPFVRFDGATQWLSRADGGAGNWADITGTETYVLASQQGLTLGGWFWFDDAPPPAAVEILIGKVSAAAGNYSYWLQRGAGTGNITFAVSDNGNAITSVNSGTTLGQQNTWHFIAGRFDNTNNEIKLWVNDESWTQAFNLTIFDGTAAFTVGAESGGAARLLDGRASMCFLGACAAYDAHLFSLFHQQRAMYGV